MQAIETPTTATVEDLAEIVLAKRAAITEAIGPGNFRQWIDASKAWNAWTRALFDRFIEQKREYLVTLEEGPRVEAWRHHQREETNKLLAREEAPKEPAA